MNNELLNVDIFIKNEGYCDIKFLSLKAKVWAAVHKIPNSLQEFGKEFCCRPVFYYSDSTTYKEGLYSIGVNKTQMKNIVKHAKLAGFIIESEF